MNDTCWNCEPSYANGMSNHDCECQKQLWKEVMWEMPILQFSGDRVYSDDCSVLFGTHECQHPEKSAQRLSQAANAHDALYDLALGLREYFEGKADAETFVDGVLPNQEMRILTAINEALEQCK